MCILNKHGFCETFAFTRINPFQRHNTIKDRWKSIDSIYPFAELLTNSWDFHGRRN
jgi:hypothetical protein